MKRYINKEILMCVLKKKIVFVKFTLILFLLITMNVDLHSQEKYDITYGWSTTNFYGWKYTVLFNDKTNDKAINGNFVGGSSPSFGIYTVSKIPTTIKGSIKIEPNGIPNNSIQNFSHSYSAIISDCLSLNSNTTSNTCYYFGTKYTNTSYPGNLYVKNILPYYNITTHSEGAIACGDDYVVIKLTNSKVYCGNVKLQVKGRSSSSWSPSITKSVSNQYVNISFNNVSGYVNKGELFDVRVLKPDGTTSPPVTGYIFLPSPNLEVNIVSPKCYNEEAIINITGLNPVAHKEMFLKWGTLTSIKNNNAQYEYPIGSGKYLYVDKQEADEVINVAETSKTLSKEITKSAYYFFEVRYDGAICSDYEVLSITNPTQVNFSEISASNVIEQTTTTSIFPEYNYQAASSTATGSATVTVSEGTGSYQYSVNEGSWVALPTTKIISGLSSSSDGTTHSIKIRDTNGCTVATAKEVTIKCPPSLSINTITEPSTFVCGNATTSFKYKVIGGVGPFKATLKKDENDVSSYTNIDINNRGEFTVTGLTQGDYVLTVTDQNSTQSNKFDTKSFSVEERGNPTFDLTSTPTSYCNNSGNDGGITISNTKGHGAAYKYSYKLTTANAYTSSLSKTISSLAAGQYNVKVENSGCSTTNTVTVLKRSVPSVSLKGVTTNQICEQKGSASFTISGLQTNDSYTLQILNSSKTAVKVQNNETATSAGNNTSTFTNKIEGSINDITYYPKVIVSGNKGCSSVGDSFTVGKASNPLSSISYSKLIDESCVNKSNAVIQLTDYDKINGSYSLSGGGTLNSTLHKISGLSATPNSYSLTITESTGRQCSHTINVNDIAVSTGALSATEANKVDADCTGSTTGSVVLNASSGRSSDGTATTTNYKFYLNNTLKATQTKGRYAFENLSDGNYNIKVIDDVGCEVAFPITIGITPNNPVTINNATNIKDQYCTEGTKGSFSISASTRNANNTLKYDISDSNQSFDNKNSNQSVSFTSLAAKTYTVTVTDKEANCSNTKSIIVGNKNYTPNVHVNYSNELACDEANDGEATVSVIDYNSTIDKGKGFSYSLKDENKNSVSSQNQSNTLQRIFAGLDKQTYTLEVKDAFGCKNTQNINVPLRADAIQLGTVTKTQTSCPAANNGTISVSASQGVIFDGSYTFNLYKNDDSAFKETLDGVSVTFTGLFNGSYYVKAIDDEDCAIQSGEITVTSVTNQLSILPQIVDNPDCTGGDDGSIDLTIENDNFTNAQYEYNLYKQVAGTYQLLASKPYDSNDEKFYNLSNGIYKAEVKEVGQLCSSSYDGIVVQDPIPIQIISPQIKCITTYGESTGVFSVKIAEGNKNYKYKWYKNNVLIESSILSYPETETEVEFVKTGLSAGVYKFTLNDISNCNYFNGADTYEKEVIITAPSKPLTIDADVINESCAGSNDGQVELTAAGGWLCSEHNHNGETCSNIGHGKCNNWNEGEATTKCPEADYLFSIGGQSWQCSNKFTNLQPGDYVFWVKDKAGNKTSYPITINARSAMSLNITSNIDATCPGYSNGIVKANVTIDDLGKDNINYTLSSVNGNNASFEDVKLNGNNVFEYGQLPKGAYRLFISDLNSCTDVKNFSIGEPEIAQISVSNNFIRAKGEETGEITLNIEKGNQWFDYKCFFNNEETPFEEGQIANTIELRNLPAGDYKIKVRDTAGCVYEATEWMEREIKMEEPEKFLRFNLIENKPASCFEYTDGKIEVEAEGGWGEYTFVNNTADSQDDGVFDNLSSGVYNIIITDKAGISWDSTIVINQPDLLEATYLKHKDINCFGGNDGEIEVAIQGGNEHHYISVDEENWNESSIVDGLIEGTYNVYVKDEKNCTDIISDVVLEQPDEIIKINSEIIKSRCSNNEGSIKAEFEGGVGQLTYQWYKLSDDYSQETLMEGEETTEVNNLYSSRYKVLVTDEHSCALPFEFVIGDITDLAIDTIKVLPVTCFGYSDGSATAEVLNGNKPYYYSWPSAVTQFINSNAWGIKAETYQLLVRDDKGCSASKEFTIQTPEPLSYDTIQFINPLCNGGVKGELEVEAKGGTPSYTYQWSQGSEINTATNLTPGQYQLTIGDDHNCSAQFNIDMHYQRELKPFVGNDTLICHYDVLPLDAGDYKKFSWTSDNEFSSSKQEIEIENPGEYYLEVTDKDKCLGYDTINLDVSYLQIESFDYKDVTCNGDADGWAQLSTSPSNWDHTIEWTDGTATNKWSGLSGGDYSVKVFDEYGCEDKREFSIYEPDELSLTVNKLMNPLCFGIPDGEIKLSTSGGRKPYSYTWKNQGNENHINKLDTGYYFVDIYDEKNCHISKGFNLKYETAIHPVLGDDKVLCEGNTVRLYPGEFDSYKWSNSIGASATDTAFIASDKADYYVEVKDYRDCVGRDTVKIETRTTDLTPEFLMASSVPAGDTLMIIEVSHPKSQSFDWDFSGKHKVAEQTDFYCKVIFEEEGVYEIILNAHSYNCSAQARKSILVTSAINRDANGEDVQKQNRKIQSLVASPNPSKGEFNAKLELDEAQEATYYLVRIENGKIIDKRKVNGMAIYNERFNVGAPGVYAVFVEVGEERQVVKVVVN